ncbi:tRNA lysidine(34) synthetase TilS [Ectothiorhodospira mobilis]|uniref:tRNA lysidine(34) synthetase TilS n=1 Tax=Ectothiorhodospira mobilis TaxID=195064 RepID=UPI001907356E|nr:tRNA lysidine(34) synthetase TilS [Ectothiorhodospira mobilis]MBK1692580.1 tRNA lysidine(34) synthetase TilS [Ectothiorhodospira mobilis]
MSHAPVSGTDVPGPLSRALDRLPPARRHLVGLSGGLDSVVLLHALAGLARDLPLIAVHVHHGLSPRAEDWAGACGSLCRRLQIPFHCLRVDAAPGRGESPEAAARRARYDALAGFMQPGDGLLTAHHRRDQAETLLLQLLRGAGPAGLAAMPLWQPLGPGWHGRPLLEVDRPQLEAHARAHGLDWVEDESNQDPALDRNRLRHEILPLLRARWPAVDATLARAAALQAEAQDLLAERAREDLETLRGETPGTLSVAALARLRRPRQRNALRGWLQEKGLPLPGRARLETLLQQALVAAPEAAVRVAWPGAEVRRYRDALYAMAPLPSPPPGWCLPWDGHTPLAVPGTGVTLTREGVMRRHGLDPAALPAPVTVRLRRGGERLRLGGRTRVLKKLLQAQGVPPWERERIPLIHAGDRLVVVWGLWTAETP